MLEINKSYMREDADNFSLPAGEERVNKIFDINKCNFYTDSGVEKKYILHTYSVGDFDRTIKKMIVTEGEDGVAKCASGVSVHFVIDKNGQIYQLMPIDKKPWAAGVGAFTTDSKLNKDISDNMKNQLNAYAISIMSINDGKSPFSQEQEMAIKDLTKHLVDEHQISESNIVGLNEWAVGRHIAPGPFFPWVEMKKSIAPGLLFPDPNEFQLKDNADVIVSWKESEQHENETKEDILSSLTELFKKFGITNLKSQEFDKSTSLAFNIAKVLPFAYQADGFDLLKGNWDALHNDSSDPEASAILGAWTENSQAALDMILDI